VNTLSFKNSDGFVGLSPSSRKGLLSLTEEVLFQNKYPRNSVSYYTSPNHQYFIGYFNESISNQYQLPWVHYTHNDWLVKDFHLLWAVNASSLIMENMTFNFNSQPLVVTFEPSWEASKIYFSDKSIYQLVYNQLLEASLLIDSSATLDANTYSTFVYFKALKCENPVFKNRTIKVTFGQFNITIAIESILRQSGKNCYLDFEMYRDTDESPEVSNILILNRRALAPGTQIHFDFSEKRFAMYGCAIEGLCAV
jgi:hypothetical protein